MSSVHLALLVTALSLGGAVSVSATPITIDNPGFETGINPGVFTTVNAGGTNITDWTVSSGSVDYIGTYWTAAEGVRSLDMNGNAAGAIQQKIDVPYDGNVTIRFRMAGNPDLLPDPPVDLKFLTVSLFNTTQSFTFDAAGKSHGAMGWVYEAALFTGVTQGEWTLQFAGNAANTFYGAALDDVSASIPDGGATAALLGLAMTGLGLVRRKKA